MRGPLSRSLVCLVAAVAAVVMCAMPADAQLFGRWRQQGNCANGSCNIPRTSTYDSYAPQSVPTQSSNYTSTGGGSHGYSATGSGSHGGSQYGAVSYTLKTVAPQDAEEVLIVAESGGVIKGYALYTSHEDRIELQSIVVQPDQRRQGIGTALVNKVKSKMTAEQSTIEVTADNDGAKAFFDATGFENVGGNRYEYQSPTAKKAAKAPAQDTSQSKSETNITSVSKKTCENPLCECPNCTCVDCQCGHKVVSAPPGDAKPAKRVVSAPPGDARPAVRLAVR